MAKLDFVSILELIAKKEEAPVEQEPVEPVEQAPAVEEVTAEEAEIEEIPELEEVPIGEAPVEEPPAVEETAPIEEAPVAPAPVEEKPAEEKPIEAPVAPIKVEEKPAEPQQNVKPGQIIKANRKPIYEQTIKEFLPVSLIIIVGSIILWIINGTLHPTGFFAKGFPFLLFLTLQIFTAVTSMIRAIKTLNRKMYLRSALSFVLFGLLVTCVFVTFFTLIG